MPADNYAHVQPDLMYVDTNLPGKGFVDEGAINVGCSCTDNCCQGCECLKASGGQPNYDSNSKLNNYGRAIFECRDLCSCCQCSNRVVQAGPIEGLKVIETKNKGLGLACNKAIAKGTFVCEYAGELISPEAANERSAKDPMNYILHVVEHFKTHTQTTVIDPTVIGNIGRYMNHSCDPNLSLVPVRVDSMSPRVALFANRDIPSEEELTFDYGNSSSDLYRNSRPCQCGTLYCCGFLPFQTSIRIKET